MRISKITFRHRNDFYYDATCKCGHTSSWKDGYADDYYCSRVVPARACPKCGLNEYGLSDHKEPPREKAAVAA